MACLTRTCCGRFELNAVVEIERSRRNRWQMNVGATFPVLEERPIRRKRRPLPRWFQAGCWLIIVAFALLGAVLSSRTMARKRSLEAETARIRPLAAPLTIDAPDRVHIVSVPHVNEIEGQWEWRFRMHFPAGYDYRVSLAQGLITADGAECAFSKEIAEWAMSPSDIMLGSQPHSSEGLGGIALFEDERSSGRRIQLINHASGQRSYGKRKGYCIDDIDDPRIDVAGGEGTVSFDKDKPICLLRVRERNPRATDPATGKPLYLGLFVYLIPKSDQVLPVLIDLGSDTK